MNCPIHFAIPRWVLTLGLLGGAVLSLGPRGVPGMLLAAPPPQVPVDFNRQIRSILAENCFACHGPDEKKRKAGLRLDTKEGAFEELAEGGRAIVPGKPADSVLIKAVTAANARKRMSPAKTGKQLTPPQIDLLRQWIAQGAKWTGHWAFSPPKKPALPDVENKTWPRNPIDHFILARLQTVGLKPSPEADKTVLIRRVTLDLTGLPPTLAEVDAFLADTTPDAFEKLVERLLKSLRFGEHQARYWLDVARYGDTHGLHLDNYREMWPYRDWVIQAFNNNMPYDRFLIEQLAGDLLPNPTLEQIVASGFNRCHVTTAEGGSIEEECYVRNVDDRVETVGTVLLGVTLGCARCHDHKYDPIRMKDFYQTFAFFNSLDTSPLDGNAAQYPPIVKVMTPEQRAGLDRLQIQVDSLKQTISAKLAQIKYEDPGETKEPAGTVTPPAQKNRTLESLLVWQRAQKAAAGVGLPPPIQNLVKLDSTKLTAQQKKELTDYFLERVYSKTRTIFDPLHQQLAQAEKERQQIEKQIPTTLVSQERSEPRPAFLLKRGEYDQRGEKVGRETPPFLPPMPANAPKNRLGYAQWLVMPGHPLTARVFVNRLWQQLFGAGLVKTAEDFGIQGEPPSHPELLDWLAVQFVEDGWDIKKTLKRMVTSAAYRQSSRVTPERLAKDPENRLLSRGPRYRLEAEMLRDQALALSGLLVEKIGGPSVKPPQPVGIWEAVGYTGSNTARFTPDTGHDKVHRRSLYTFWKRTAPPPQMTTFDAPSRETCLVRRERTDTPLQALLIMNETQYVEAARALAERIMREGGTTVEARLTWLFRLATARPPDSKELAELKAVFQDHLAAFTRDEKGAKELIVVGETKPDAKIDPKELAAWTMVASLVLNLDEVLNKN